MRNLYVVGDCFNSYADLKGVYTSGDLLGTNIISTENLNSILSDPNIENIILGQGLSLRDRSSLNFIISNHGKDKNILHKNTPLCGEKHVHKKQIENSLITLPIITGENTFTSNVFISDKNELIQDHISGNHIQGMIVVEAFRQLILATTEEYLSINKYRKMSFVWNEITTRFKSYVFPIDIQVSLNVTESKQIKPSRHTYKGTFTLKQGNEIVCTGYSEWDTLDSKLLCKQESLRATKSVV